MERAYEVFGDLRYQRLSAISVARLYNLRQTPKYLLHRQVWTKTRTTTTPIGCRPVPMPNNRPGYLRVDSVHQGDQDGIKGVYHINAVDCVTQYEGVATCLSHGQRLQVHQSTRGETTQQTARARASN